MKETVIKILESILSVLKGNSVLNTAKLEALDFIDAAAEKAVEDVNALFSGSSVFKDVGRYADIANRLKNSPLVSSSDNILEIVSFVSDAASVLGHLNDFAVSAIRSEQNRLRNMVSEAASEDAIEEILKLSAPILSATPSYLSSVFLKGSFR